MTSLSNDLLVAAVGLVMVLSGRQKSLLERRENRTCPGCGREIRVCRCR